MQNMLTLKSHPAVKILTSLLIGRLSAIVWGTSYSSGTIYHLYYGNNLTALTFAGLTLYQIVYFLALRWISNNPLNFAHVLDYVTTMWRQQYGIKVKTK